jgi:hypothetical protein
MSTQTKEPNGENELPPDDELTPEQLEEIARIGEMLREVRDAADRNDAPIVAQALLVWEQDAQTDEDDHKDGA